MKCPFCGHLEHKVLESRVARNNSAIRRRRECLACERRFTTFEVVEVAKLFVIKRDGSREEFSQQKLIKSMAIACRKRDIPLEHLELAAARIENKLAQEIEAEVSSKAIGEKVLDELFSLDTVAYVRFASVYKEFETVSDFDSILLGVKGETQRITTLNPKS